MKATREDMLRDIEAEVRYTRQMIGRDAFAPEVMQAMGEVPREEFVPANMRGAAFENVSVAPDMRASEAYKRRLVAVLAGRAAALAAGFPEAGGGIDR